MTDADANLTNALGELVPNPTAQPDWDDALRRARRASRARRVPLFALAAAIAAGLFALAAVDPFSRSGGTNVLERALAAVGDGPVLHVVFREPPVYDAVIDRRTGVEQADPPTEIEIWYDRDRGVHYVSRVGRLVFHDVVTKVGSIPEYDALKAVATDYRGSLASGRATLVGEDELDDRTVYWIRISDRTTHARRTPSGPPTTFTINEEVAVSADGYRPVATRYTVNGEPEPHRLKRIVEFETLPAGTGEFGTPSTLPPNIGVLCCSSEETTLAGAAAILGRRPLWLGESFAGLPLARVARLEAKTKPGDGDHFTGTQSSVELFYGSLDDAGQPDLTKPHVRVVEGTPLITLMARLAVPPAGWALVDGPTATTTQDGIEVEIAGPHAPLRAALDALTAAPTG